MLFGGSYLFDRPIPQITPEGINHSLRPGRADRTFACCFLRLPRHHARDGDAPTGIGSRYRVAFFDANMDYFEGAMSYTADVPEAVLVAHAVRQPDAIDTGHAATIPACREPVIPNSCCGREPRRLDHRPLRARAASRHRGRQLCPDGAGQGMFRYPPALQPAPALLRQNLARRRSRASSVME